MENFPNLFVLHDSFWARHLLLAFAYIPTQNIVISQLKPICMLVKGFWWPFIGEKVI